MQVHLRRLGRDLIVILQGIVLLILSLSLGFSDIFIRMHEVPAPRTTIIAVPDYYENENDYSTVQPREELLIQEVADTPMRPPSSPSTESQASRPNSIITYINGERGRKHSGWRPPDRSTMKRIEAWSASVSYFESKRCPIFRRVASYYWH